MLRMLCAGEAATLAGRLTHEFIEFGAPVCIETSTDGIETLGHLSHAVYDVVLASPELHGVRSSILFQDIQAQYPSILRFLLSTSNKNDAISEVAGFAHQTISPDIKARELYRILQTDLSQLGKIREDRIVRTLSRLEKLPLRSAMMGDFLQLLSSQEPSVEAICETVSKHPGMVAQILKVANSPFFGHAGTIENLDEGISLLGLDMVAALFFSMQVMRVETPPRESQLNADTLWAHSVQVALVLRTIAKHIKAPPLALREACTAALLHDIGKIVAAQAMPHEFAAALTMSMADGIPLWQAEKRILGNSHAEIGACLLRLWGFPDSLIDLIGAHHAPHKMGEGMKITVLLLHLSDAVAHALDGKGTPIFLDSSYLESAGLPTELAYWQKVATAD